MEFWATTAGKAPKAWALPRFWVLIHSYEKQPVKKIWDRVLGLAWLKFAIASLGMVFMEVPVVMTPVCPVRLDFSVLDWEIFFINDG